MRSKGEKQVPLCACCGCLSLFWVLMCITTIPAGHIGLIDLFGSVSSSPLQPGLTLVNPFASVVLMSVKTQIIEMAEDVPTREGLTVHLEAAALVRLEANEARKMYITVGADYLNTVVIPQFRSVIRAVTSGHEAKDLYTAKSRQNMTTDLRTGLTELIRNRGLIVEDTPLKKLELPASLRDSIEDKARAEQDNQKMEWILEREKQEAERKAIEASGIAEFQRIVSGDINEGMLRWKGIEATEQLAESSNPKVVVIGGSSDGKDGHIPFILNADGKEVKPKH
eukprot:TRINITY_DN67208_c7_g1_i1.p2 TRINITY_DN67208_c7_g1~~TRINITY_DN67208_c7_g1_i1.p2  ORF type:complete len:282 (-),score=44.74 TRINITY_DN67208_c7_g1_i1:1584-2429(-)